MKKYKFKNVNWLLISGIVLILLSVTSMGVLFCQNQNLKKQMALLRAQPTPIQTSSLEPWEIINYSSDSMGGWLEYKTANYKFDYPQDWKIEPTDDLNKILVCAPGWRRDLPEGGKCFSVEILDNISLDKFIEQYNSDDSSSPGIYVPKNENYIMGGKPVTKMTAGTALGIDANLIFTEHKGKSYLIDYMDRDKVHVGILSTFKFL